MDHFTRLIEENHPRLVMWLTKKTGDHYLAQDILQDAYLHLIENGAAQSIQAVGLLFTEAAHKFIDHLRRNRKWAGMASVDEMLNLTDPRDEIERVILRDEIRYEMAKMPKAQREVAELMAQDMTTREIAEALALPMGTVKSRMNYFRTKNGRVKRTKSVDIRKVAKQLLRENGRITTGSLAKASGCSEQLANYHLSQMERKGYIVTCGVEMTGFFASKGNSPRWVWGLAPRTVRKSA